MSKQLDWDVFRYVLDDPALDRAAFEQRMLHDDLLAWAVADAVETVEQLRIASRFLDKSSLLEEFVRQEQFAEVPVQVAVSADASSRPVAVGWHWSSLAALAAGLLLLIGAGSASLMQYGGQQVHSLTDSLAMRSQAVSTQALADRWLALDATSEADWVASETLPEDQDSRWSFSDSSQVSSEPATEAAADDHDWLMEAASLFYAEGAAS